MPNTSPENRRLENRVVGVDANPYLAISVGLACGFRGMLRAIEPAGPEAGEPDEDAFPIPLTLDEALTRFEAVSTDFHKYASAQTFVPRSLIL